MSSIDKWNLTLSGTDSQIKWMGGPSTLTNFFFTGLGTVLDSGGTTTIGGDKNYSEVLDCNLILGNGATITDSCNCSLTFGKTVGNLYFQINPLSTLNLQNGTGVIHNIISSNSTGNYFDVNGGTLSYAGMGALNRVVDTIAAAILLENNGGDFLVNGGGGGSLQGAWLKINGSHTAPDGIAASVRMKEGSVQLSGGCILQATQDYYESYGILESTDTSAVTLQDGATGNLGTANITGGYLDFAQTQGQQQYGSMTIICKVLNFSATYAPKINAAASGTSDLLQIQGTMNINAGSSLQVQVVGTLNPNLKGMQNWTIINGASNALNAFSSNNDAATGLTDWPNKPKNGSYQMSW